MTVRPAGRLMTVRPAGGSVALIDGVDVDAVAAAVAACPGVSGLYGGPGDAIASYLPGRRVPGVQVNRGVVVMHVRSRWGVSAADILAQIAGAVSPLRHGLRFDVVIADIDDPAAEPVVSRPPGSAPPPSAPLPEPVPPHFPTV